MSNEESANERSWIATLLFAFGALIFPVAAFFITAVVGASLPPIANIPLAALCFMSVAVGVAAKYRIPREALVPIATPLLNMIGWFGFVVLSSFGFRFENPYLLKVYAVFMAVLVALMIADVVHWPSKKITKRIFIALLVLPAVLTPICVALYDFMDRWTVDSMETVMVGQHRLVVKNSIGAGGNPYSCLDEVRDVMPGVRMQRTLIQAYYIRELTPIDEERFSCKTPKGVAVHSLKENLAIVESD